MAQLRQELPVLTSSVIRAYAGKGHLLAFFRGEAGKGELLVMANNGTEPVSLELPTGDWKYINGKMIVQDKNIIEIPPLQVKILEHI